MKNSLLFKYLNIQKKIFQNICLTTFCFIIRTFSIFSDWKILADNLNTSDHNALSCYLILSSNLEEDSDCFVRRALFHKFLCPYFKLRNFENFEVELVAFLSNFPKYYLTSINNVKFSTLNYQRLCLKVFDKVSLILVIWQVMLSREILDFELWLSKNQWDYWTKKKCPWRKSSTRRTMKRTTSNSKDKLVR